MSPWEQLTLFDADRYLEQVSTPAPEPPEPCPLCNDVGDGLTLCQSCAAYWGPKVTT